MKIAFPWQAYRQIRFGSRLAVFAMTVAFLLATVNLFAATTATTVELVGGQGQPGYANGDTYHQALFNTPCGLALDPSGTQMLVADRDNNKIRLLELSEGETYDLAISPSATNLISHPVAVAIDGSLNVFVLNRGDGNNGTVVEFDGEFGDLIATNAAHLTNATAMALDAGGNIFVTIKSNTLIRITSPGVSNVVATITQPGAFLQGIVIKHNGLIAACDSGRNGIYLINPTSGIVTTNAGFHGAGDFLNPNNSNPDAAPSQFVEFNQPMGIAEAGDGSLIVTDYGNNRVKVIKVSNGAVTNLYGVASSDWVSPYLGFSSYAHPYDGLAEAVQIPDTIGGVSARLPNGIVISPNGDIYVTEDYYHIIRHVSGAGFPPPPPSLPGVTTGLTATAGYGHVFLTWTAVVGATNYNVKRSTASGGETTIASTVNNNYADNNVIDGTTYYYVVSALNTGGESQNSTEVSAMPLYSPAPTNLIVTATNFGLISLAWSPSVGETGYNVKRSPSSGGPYANIATNITALSYTDTGLVNGTTYYYVVSAVNAGGENPTNSLEVSAYVPIPPPPPPVIGWFDYEPDIHNNFLTVIHAVSGANYFTAYNDLLIAINPTTNGISTCYIATNGPQPVSISVSSLTNNGSNPLFYQDGLAFAQSLYPNYLPTVPDIVIEAVNVGPGGSSPVVTAEFRFQVGNPTINGNNAAQFTVSDITTNVTLWYTLDGTNPTNAPPSIGPVAITNGNPMTLSINGSSNVLFQARAYRNGFLPSGIAVQLFSPSNFVPNTISFGFASGEASSSFVASPGQTFYAPVTLSLLPNQQIYSLQFNLTVTNLGSTPPITPNAFDFKSMLLKPVPGTTPTVYIPIPPYMFVADGPSTPPPATTNSIVSYEGNWFENLMFTNTENNLLGVGWVENYYATNLYNTLSQDLIKYSAAHDDFFPNASQPNGVIVGGYSFQVPSNAAPGQTYQIQIGRPSATDDGIGAPGSGVLIYAPTNDSLGAGTLNALKNVTIGQIKYIAGDVYPFGWFNAGDFGTGDLITYGNADVEQVFQCAIYGVWYPPLGSDFFDAMDSCGGTYVDLGHGYLEYSNPVNDPSVLNALFDGNDTTINQIAFGDGVLDVCDVYVTYRRSLDPSLYWFQRFWTNGVRVAQIVPNVVSSAVQQSSGGKIKKAAATANSAPVSITNTPAVNFAAGDCQTKTGSTVQIPITASVFGQYPLRLLMLNLSVVPLDGSPPLTTPVQFTQNASVLGAPYITYSTGNDNYSAVWLNSTNAGLTDTRRHRDVEHPHPGDCHKLVCLCDSFRPRLGLTQRLRIVPQAHAHRPDHPVQPHQFVLQRWHPGFLAPALVRHHLQPALGLQRLPVWRRHQQLEKIRRRG